MAKLLQSECSFDGQQGSKCAVYLPEWCDFATALSALCSIQYFCKSLVKWSREYVDYIYLVLHREEPELHRRTGLVLDKIMENWVHWTGTFGHWTSRNR